MILKILVLIFSGFSGSAQASDWPQPNGFNCNYYLDLEHHLNCTENGSDYLVNFGYLYCLKFQDKASGWNPQLQNFINKSGQCLIDTLYDNRFSRITDCQSLEEFAFESHTACYTQSGYCELSGVEKLQISATIEWSTIFTKFWQIKSQMERVNAFCLAP